MRKSNKRIEKKLKEIADKRLNADHEKITYIILPSVEFNAIFLLRHCASHFASVEMTLR